MLEALPELPPAIGVLLFLIPLCYALGAILAPSTTGTDPAPAWRRARFTGSVALFLAVTTAFALASVGAGVTRLPPLLELGSLGALSLSVRLDVLTCVMLTLVTFIGLVILQFSSRYLEGDAGQARYVRWFLATLAAVTLLVITNNLLLLAGAWVGTSLALHQLLTHFRERPQALIAAHKKFIASRVADLCLLSATALIGRTLGTLELDEIFTRIDPANLPGSLQAAAVLLVGGAALKCAQLPFHGWLIQVMEAPTPVSALLHAGVVNIGGFLMIRLAPLMTHAEIAQTLLVICGATTAVIAALVVMTRVSVKVALAWSTCAQMGFMLLECGLGAYSLALLHLVAHSLYKAHAFLASGSVVEQWRTQVFVPGRGRPGFSTWLVAAAISTIVVLAVGSIFGIDPSGEPALWALVTIVALALTPLIVHAQVTVSTPLEGGSLTSGIRRFAALATVSTGVATLYFAWHLAFNGMLGVSEVPGTTSALNITIVLVAFAGLFLVQAALSARPQGRIAEALYQPLFAGLYLDELFTRLTFKLWPAKVPRTPPQISTTRTLNQGG